MNIVFGARVANFADHRVQWERCLHNARRLVGIAALIMFALSAGCGDEACEKSEDESSRHTTASRLTEKEDASIVDRGGAIAAAIDSKEPVLEIKLDSQELHVGDELVFRELLRNPGGAILKGKSHTVWVDEEYDELLGERIAYSEPQFAKSPPPFDKVGNRSSWTNGAIPFDLIGKGFVGVTQKTKCLRDGTYSIQARWTIHIGNESHYIKSNLAKVTVLPVKK